MARVGALSLARVCQWSLLACALAPAVSQQLRAAPQLQGPTPSDVSCTRTGDLEHCRRDLAALATLRRLLRLNNREHSVKVGPLSLPGFSGFHNHVAHFLVAMYRIGANASRLQAGYVSAGAGIVSQTKRRITARCFVLFVGVFLILLNVFDFVFIGFVLKS